jgi:hypothetical protein
MITIVFFDTMSDFAKFIPQKELVCILTAGSRSFRSDTEIYNWDGQTLCSNPDFLRNKTSLTSEVPFFCSNFNRMSSSSNY